MGLLDQDGFVSELAKLYEKRKLGGSVWISMKRVSRDVRTPRKQPIGAKCLVRATDGKKKISCAVLAKDSIRFQLDLMDVVKAHTGGLKDQPKKTRGMKGKTS
ncbi:hypothetical protein BU14_0113s0010 [Porphyra umbilicalis]|uniref:Signal recognition particle 14 kDa protein n=1 Tax=Porphyra umbilicalis TaxID=2786 RepID=A0A1X6PC30_PORUM|nr:hypothetical protein BU14_0113s0010 [Porphyra umbilicalis]|eukprot:OSX78265.1 hypothetical protein BU14_0113s0010 [Porphyra umbilicalis]